MILQTGWWGDELAERAKNGPHYEISFEEILDIVKEYQPGRVVLTHIGDELGMCLKDLGRMEEKYKKHNISFAYDGMEIHL